MVVMGWVRRWWGLGPLAVWLAVFIGLNVELGPLYSAHRGVLITLSVTVMLSVPVGGLFVTWFMRRWIIPIRERRAALAAVHMFLFVDEGEAADLPPGMGGFGRGCLRGDGPA